MVLHCENAVELNESREQLLARRGGVRDRSFEERTHPFPLYVGHIAQPRETPFDVVGEAVARIIHLDAGVVQEREQSHVLEDGVSALTIAHGMKVRTQRPRFTRR